MSDTARGILETVFCFSKGRGNITHETIDIQDRTPIHIKDMTITPHTVDHSAYGAFNFLIEVDGKKVLHTGDFRNHGYKGKLLKTTLEDIGKVFVLITEGTILSRPQVKAQSEAELAKEMIQKTKSYDKVLVLMSTTNIDRVTTLTRVANRTGKTFIHDILLSNVLRLVTPKIPNALNSPKVQVFLPSFIFLLKDKEEYKQFIDPYQNKMKQTGKALHGKFIMNVRISMLRDIEKLKLKSQVLDNAVLIYSLWERIQRGRGIQAIPITNSRIRY